MQLAARLGVPVLHYYGKYDQHDPVAPNRGQPAVGQTVEFSLIDTCKWTNPETKNPTLGFLAEWSMIGMDSACSGG